MKIGIIKYRMPVDWGSIATAAAISGSQMAIDTASGAVKSRRGYKYSNKLAEEQQRRNKEMTDYNMEKQMELWELTGPVGQKEQYKEAGLNAALMYGMGGGGGQSTNVNTANQGTPGLEDVSADGGANVGMALQRGMEMQLLKAQKENIEADTKNKEADADLKSQQEGNVWQDTENKVEQHSEIQARVQNLAQDTMKKVQEVEQLRIANKINDKSAEDQIKQFKYEAINEFLTGFLIKAQTKNVGQQTEESKKKVLQIEGEIKGLVQQLMINWKNATTEKQKMDILRDSQMFNEETDLEEVLKGLNVLIPLGGGAGQKVIQGFRR